MAQRGDQIQVKIENLAYGGEGIAKISTPEGNLVVFVPKSVPGDHLTIEITKAKKSHLEGEIVNIIEPSPDRINPICPHFLQGCGGCTFQNINYQTQLKYKTNHVREVIERIGQIPNPNVKDCLYVEPTWNYRNKMELSIDIDKHNKFYLGFHKKGNFYETLNLNECHLFSSWFSDFIKSAHNFFLETYLPAFEGFKSKLTSMIIRRGVKTNELMIILQGENYQPPFLTQFKDFLNNFFQNLPELKLVSVMYNNVINRRGQCKQNQIEILQGTDFYTETMTLKNHLFKFKVEKNSFFQPNTNSAELIYNQILNLTELTDQTIVYDLYAGTGTIGLAISKHVKSVHAIELNQNSVNSAIQNQKLNQIQNYQIICDDAAKLKKYDLPKPNLIIVDPPRNGLDPKPLMYLIELNSPEIIYVSCNPSTLARDLKELTTAGYKLISAQPIDQFSHTYHIETICLLQKKSTAEQA